MDHLWEAHGRRLSEAGLRRGSDTSVVLTEDTDSFIIGDRVWVGGTKPGAIAYIGETQFAPGDWAGVVLDEPIGKNDGSVAGCRYFQCEPKKGIFSRLTKLTRQPLTDLSLISPTQRTPTTPPDSTRGSLSKSMSPSLNASTTSLSSTVSQRDLRIGERVIVSSSQGSKTGVLRYIGTTEFAPGEWCGVELDEPIGKNDGSVGDKRYFECQPKHGLFAPVHKVSRSPSSKRSACLVHRPTGAALNSSLKKAGSRESLASVSSIASTTASLARTGPGTARETLKEKQQEIEILRKERDVERERVTKAASQADQAEQSAISIKQEYERYREEMQKTVSETELALRKMIEEKNALVLQLEEEKRKCEDLLFRFEEESVNKDDIQKERTEQSVINTVNESRIKDLEKQLQEDRERIAQLEQENVRLFEAEEELARLRNEAPTNAAQDKIQLQDLQNENKSLMEIKVSLEKEVSEKSTLVEQCVAQIKELESKLNEKAKESGLQKESESDLRQALEEVRATLEEKCKLIEEMRKEYDNSTNMLKEELQRARETIESMKKESANEKELLLLKYEKIVEEKDGQMKVKAQALETESRKQLEIRNTALEDLKAENIKKMNELSESFNQQLIIKESKIKEVSLQLDQKISETEKLMVELSTQLDMNKKKDEQLGTALKAVEELNEKLTLLEQNNVTLSKRIEDYQTKAEDSYKVIQEKQKLEENVISLTASEAELSARLEKLCEELKLKDKELLELRSSTTAQIEELSKRFAGQLEEKTKYIDEVNADVSHKSALVSKLENDIIQLKLIIAGKDEEIKNLLEKTSELQYAYTLSEQTKTNLESELRVYESNVERLTQQVTQSENKISQVTSQKEKLELDIANLISSSADSSEQLMKYNNDLRDKEKELDEMRDKAYQTENTQKVTEQKLNSMEEELNNVNALVQQQRLEIENIRSELEKEKKLNTEYVDKIKEYQTQNNELQKQIIEAEDIKKTLESATVEVPELKRQLENKSNETMTLQKQVDALQGSHKEECSSLQRQICELKMEVTTSQEELKALQKVKTKLEADQSANRWTIEELTEKLTAEAEDRKKLESAIAEKDISLQQMDNKYLELKKLHEELIVSKESTKKDLTSSVSTMFNEKEELKRQLTVASETLKNNEDALVQITKKFEETNLKVSELNEVITTMKEKEKTDEDKLNKIQEALSGKTKELNEVVANLENKINALESQLSSANGEITMKAQLIKEFESKIKESDAKLQNVLESEVKEKQTKLEAMIKQSSELEKTHQSLQDLVDTQNADLNAKEAVINKLMAQIKYLEDAQIEKVKAEQESRNEELKRIQIELDDTVKQNKNLLVAKEALEKQLKDQESKAEILTSSMKSKEKEAEKNMQNLLEKLNVISSESAQLKEVQSTLEKENKQITAKWNETTNELKLARENNKNNYDAAGGDMKQHIDKNIDVLKLQEEHETAKSQIDFLNSLIVDMQRKNEALLCKVEVLELGVPANEADEYTRSTLDKRMAPPRPFCDICDEFGLHDTDDCPRQAQDFSEGEKLTKSPKKPPVERPYCENCEMFGHDTADCDDTETY